MEILELSHEEVCRRRDRLVPVLMSAGLERHVALERANNIACALQDGKAPPYNVAFEMLAVQIPNRYERYWVAKRLEDGWNG